MSWLMPTLVPGLLMLGAFGLERVERLLGGPRDGDRELRELLERNPPRPLGGAPMHAPRTGYPLMSVLDEPGLPTRIFRPAGLNPQLQPTRRADGV